MKRNIFKIEISIKAPKTPGAYTARFKLIDMTGHIHRSINFHFQPTHPSIQRSFVKLCAPIKRDFITLAKSHKIIMIIIPCFGPKNKYCANTCIFTSSPTATHFQQVV